MPADKSRNAMPQGSLEMLILRTLKRGAQHGYAIARHLHVASDAYFQIEEGSLYPALHRMEQRGLISAEWGPSEANRKAKFYTLTAAGKEALKEQTNTWQEMQRAISNIMNFQPAET
jgi:PadR family transcriptional regulator PadR